MTILETQIRKTAKEANITELELITAMQGECASRGDEESLQALIELKYKFIPKV